MTEHVNTGGQQALLSLPTVRSVEKTSLRATVVTGHGAEWPGVMTLSHCVGPLSFSALSKTLAREAKL